MPRQPSKATLKKAAKLLQRAHDVIELHGFDIHEYGELAPADVQEGEEIPPMCYIGNIRFAAGIAPTPGADNTNAGGWESDATEGDGPELVVALETLDKLAKRRIPAVRKNSVVNEPRPSQVGRFVEALGFEIQERSAKRFPMPPWPNTNSPRSRGGGAWIMFDDQADAVRAQRTKYQRDYALRLLRQALTEIYR